MTFFEIRDLDQIAALPDGTLISWYTIAGDPSSEACAFVRHVIDPMPGYPAPRGTVWVSPGNGWEPESLHILVLPVRVIRLGQKQVPMPELEPNINITTTLDSGGTYPRDLALQCATQIAANTARGDVPIEACIDVTVRLADAFAGWLTTVPGHSLADFLESVRPARFTTS